MADTFALDVSKFAAKASKAPGVVLRKIGIDLLRSTVLATPVGNPDLWQNPAPKGYVGGRLRANWNASIGTPDLSTSTVTDKSGTTTIAAGALNFARADGERDLYIMNSLPYVREIEYESHSSQAPAGMVRITVAKFQSYVDKAARSAK